MKTDNELIASFMGLPLTKDVKNFGNSDWHKEPFQKWRYNTSWDWLMPVVQKTFDTEFNDDFEQWQKLNSKIREALLLISIEAVYSSVVDFIKWHNQQKP